MALPPCNSIKHLKELSGTITGDALTAVCGWNIAPGAELIKIDVRPLVARLAENDKLYVYTTSSTMLAQYSRSAEFPSEGLTLNNYNEVLLVFHAKSNQTRLELEYQCTARHFLLEILFPTPLVVLALTAFLVILILFILASLVCFCRECWQLDQALESFPVVLHSGMPVAMLDEEERIACALEVLPTASWSRLRVGEPEKCCFCLDVFKEDDILRLLPCDHIFHRECVDKWFASRRYMPRSCPLCKRNPVLGVSSCLAAGSESQEPIVGSAARAPAEAWGGGGTGPMLIGRPSAGDQTGPSLARGGVRELQMVSILPRQLQLQAARDDVGGEWMIVDAL